MTTNRDISKLLVGRRITGVRLCPFRLSPLAAQQGQRIESITLDDDTILFLSPYNYTRIKQNHRKQKKKHIADRGNGGVSEDL